MRTSVRLSFVAAVTLGVVASVAAPADAAVFTVFSLPSNAGITCSAGGALNSDTPVSVEGGCSAAGGSASGRAVAGFGAVGASAEAVHLGGSSTPAGWNSRATFSDNIVFSSFNATATTAEVAIDLALTGILIERLFGGFAIVDAQVTVGNRTFFFSSISGSQGVERNDFTVISGAIDGSMISAVLRSPTVTVPLNRLSLLTLSLAVTAGANFDDGARAMADFSNTFEFPIGADAFLLPPGVTANAGQWLVDNRRISASETIPEPETWAMMLLGFSAVGYSTGRRRRAVRHA